MKKRIGISFTHTRFQDYWDWFSAADLGDDLEKVELSFEKNNLSDMYSCDGFLLTGGIDIDPSRYNGGQEYENGPDRFEPLRDLFEARIYAYAKQHRLPVLGICRGLQLVNVLEGGKLIQDLASGNTAHRREEDQDKLHTVQALRDSLLFQVTGLETGTVNSAHHQAIEPAALGRNLRVSARAEEDGAIIEALEYDNKEGMGFMLCVQWHPERMADKERNAYSYRLRKRFLEEVRNVQAVKRPVINPATEDLLGMVRDDDQVSLDRKMDLLRSAQPSWAARPLEERIDILKNFSQLLERHRDELADHLSREVGKPLQQAINEINGARNRINWLTSHAARYLSDEVMHQEPGLEERISYEPLGVICNISAWNYPYLVGVNVIVPALLAGNAVLYKPSEHALWVGMDIQRMLWEAGVPDGLIQLGLGARDTGERLLQMSFDGYFFTGSYATGHHIYETLAPRMVPVQCEMGGKDPLYVADDVADVAAVAAATADGAFYNNGQSCCAVERIYVHERIYDAYVEAFVREVKSWKLGAPDEAGVYFGALCRKEQLAVLEGQVKDALDKGAVLAAGGHRVNRRGYYFEPTVLLQVNHEMKVMREESFGPVIGIMKVSNDEEAIRLMADTEYGLTAAVYSSAANRAGAILQKLDAGSGYWNCCDRVSAALPWSGRRHSGFGATLSHAGLRAFAKPKAWHLRG